VDGDISILSPSIPDDVSLNDVGHLGLDILLHQKPSGGGGISDVDDTQTPGEVGEGFQPTSERCGAARFGLDAPGSFDTSGCTTAVCVANDGDMLNLERLDGVCEDGKR